MYKMPVANLRQMKDHIEYQPVVVQQWYQNQHLEIKHCMFEVK